MTRDPTTIAPDVALTEAFAMFKNRGFRRLPVMDGEKLIGIITLTDLHKLLSHEPGTLAPIDPTHLKVRDVMTAEPLTAQANDSIERVALLMSKNKIASVPIVDGGKLVGIITETDIFKAFLRILGASERSVRILFEVSPEETGLAEVFAAAESYDVAVLSMVTHRSPSDTQLVVLRVKGMDTDLFINEVRKSKHRVLEVT